MEFVRQTGNPANYAGYAWLAQDIQCKETWKALALRVSSQLNLYPVIIAFSREDALHYASSLPADAPLSVVMMQDYYEHVVARARLPEGQPEVERALAEHERAFGVSMLRGLILSDRHLGRDYLTGARGFAASKISARRSRQTIYEACYLSLRFWEQLFSRCPPSICLAYAGGAGLAGRPLALLLRARAIPFRNISYSRFADRFYWADDEFGFSPRFAAHHEAARAAAGQGGDEAIVGEQVLTTDAMRATLFKNHTWPGVLRKTVRTLLRHAWGHWKGYAKSRRGYYAFSTVGAILRARLHRSWLDRHAVINMERAVARRHVVYHALQVEPELTTTLFCEFASDQLSLVREVSLSLPATAILAVKEHPWQIGSRNIAFYRQIASLPNVVLVHPYFPSITLIKMASAVSTGSSSVAYEAAALGVPVFHVQEKSLLDVVPHAVAMRCRRDVERLRDAVFASSDADARACRTADGSRFLRALETFGFGVGSGGLLGRSTPPPEDVMDGMMRDLVESLAPTLRERLKA